MRKFQAIVGMLAVLIIASQLFRHAYVRWIDPQKSILDQFEPTRQDIANAKSVDELLVLYRPALEKVREAEKLVGPDDESESYYSTISKEPYKSEHQLKQAIQERESHKQELRDLHFFWWAGLLCVPLGAVFYLRTKPWLGMTFFVLGYLEMIWATSPSLSLFGGAETEFERLLTFKVIYSFVSLVLVFVGWGIIERPSKQDIPASQ